MDKAKIEIRDDSKLAKLDLKDARFGKADAIGLEVMRRLSASALHRSTAMAGKYSVSQTLINCFNQRHGIYSPEDAAVIAQIGNDAYINLTELKTSAAEGIFKDNIIAPGGAPFYVEATPIPSLSKAGRLEAMREVIKRALENGMVPDPDALMGFVHEAKSEVKEQEQVIADEKAKAMNKLIKDQCEEGGYRTAMMEFLQDFVLYPYAVMEGPIVAYKERDKWVGDKFKTVYEPTYEFRRVSPFDFYWTEDSTNTQDGTGVTIVERVAVHTLYELLETPTYMKEGVDRALDMLENNRITPNWLLNNKEARASHGLNAIAEDKLLDLVRHYGVFKGQDLIDMGVSFRDKKTKEKIEPRKFYECTVIVVAGITIQLTVSNTTGLHKRPVHTATYEKRGYGIPGVAIAQKLRDVERIYLSALRALVSNMNYAAKPITEIDIARLVEGVDFEKVLDIKPGMAVPADSKSMPNAGPVLRFYNVPSHIPAYSAIMEQFMALADRITQIPAAMHGEPVGTGANRTFRGVALLQGNVLKTIQASTMNIDEGINAPIGELLYRYNMIYSKDSSIKGDAQVVARGASTMLDKEVARQNILEALMLVGNTGVADPNLINYLVYKLLEDLDIPEHILKGSGLGGTISPNTPDPQANEVSAMEAEGVPAMGAEYAQTSVQMAESDIV